MAATTVEVTILNQKFLLKTGQASEEYVRHVAAYVNDKMLEIQARVKSVSTANVAILTAINIADDYLKKNSEVTHLNTSQLETHDTVAQLQLELGKMRLQMTQSENEKRILSDQLQKQEEALAKKEEDLRLMLKRYHEKEDDYKNLTDGVRQTVHHMIEVIDSELRSDAAQLH